MAKPSKLTARSTLGRFTLGSRTRCIVGEVLSRGARRRLVRYRPGVTSHVALEDGKPTDVVLIQFVENGQETQVRVGDLPVTAGAILYPDRKTGRFVEERSHAQYSAFWVRTRAGARTGALVAAVFIKPTFAKAAAKDTPTTSGGLMNPTIGAIVHYTNLGDRDGVYPPAVIAAIVTKVNEGCSVALKCFYPTGIFDMPAVDYTEGPAGSEAARGKWTLP